MAKTLPLNQQECGDNERPTQPVRIASHHNGNCGELQDLLTAAARAALIPCASWLNIAQDHVWNAFYHEDWVHYEQWWSDGGAIIGDFGTHNMDNDYNGGKDISTVWGEQGDDMRWMVPGY